MADEEKKTDNVEAPETKTEEVSEVKAETVETKEEHAVKIDKDSGVPVPHKDKEPKKLPLSKEKLAEVLGDAEFKPFYESLSEEVSIEEAAEKFIEDNTIKMTKAELEDMVSKAVTEAIKANESEKTKEVVEETVETAEVGGNNMADKIETTPDKASVPAEGANSESNIGESGLPSSEEKRLDELSEKLVKLGPDLMLKRYPTEMAEYEKLMKKLDEAKTIELFKLSGDIR